MCVGQAARQANAKYPGLVTAVNGQPLAPNGYPAGKKLIVSRGKAAGYRSAFAQRLFGAQPQPGMTTGGAPSVTGG